MSLVTNYITLPPHLIASILRLVENDVELPSDLKSSLVKATEESIPADAISPKVLEQDGVSVEPPEGHESDEPAPRFIDYDVIEQLARWADSENGRRELRSKDLEPSHYILISLLAGTEVYLPPSQTHLASIPSTSYLPSYLSPRPQTLIQEYRSTTKQLSTAFNVLFSIAGSAAAVYIASVTGAGYTRETGVILGVIAGCIVGVADGVLVWIVARRTEEGRRREEEERRRQLTGSARLEAEVDDGTDGKGDVDEISVEKPAGEPTVERRTIRLRRRAVANASR